MAAAEVQALLRFLTQDAKVPLAEALPKIGVLRKKGLNTALAISQADSVDVKDVFVDEKLMKQVINASKRVSNPKKRSASQAALPSNKRPKTNERDPSRDIETELALPTTDMKVVELSEIQLETNRAPLVLAFALVSLEYSMPEQPLSSRLSLAQAVVSANSQTRAKTLGLTSGATAEDEGWARGQPRVKVLGREIAVMRRQIQSVAQETDSQATIGIEEVPSHDAFWGLDLEELRKSNGPLVAGKMIGSHGPPIHTPKSPRSYLLKSVSIANDGKTPPGTKKQSAAVAAASREKAVAMLLKSIRLVCESWVSRLTPAELDSRAWSWYINVRPEVAQGQSGWGQRGRVRLADILKLRRDSEE